MVTSKVSSYCFLTLHGSKHGKVEVILAEQGLKPVIKNIPQLGLRATERGG